MKPKHTALLALLVVASALGQSLNIHSKVAEKVQHELDATGRYHFTESVDLQGGTIIIGPQNRAVWGDPGVRVSNVTFIVGDRHIAGVNLRLRTLEVIGTVEIHRLGDVRVSDLTIMGAGHGLVLDGPGDSCVIRDVRAYGNDGWGCWVKSTGNTNVLSNFYAQQNRSGGLLIESGSDMVVEHSTIEGNGGRQDVLVRGRVNNLSFDHCWSENRNNGVTFRFEKKGEARPGYARFANCRFPFETQRIEIAHGTKFGFLECDVAGPIVYAEHRERQADGLYHIVAPDWLRRDGRTPPIVFDWSIRDVDDQPAEKP